MKNKAKSFDKNKGITLIALVITIIVLLILAGVTIATLTGENGILTRANDAKEETEEAGAKEKVQMEVAGSFDEHGNFDMDKLKENLKENLGLQESDIKDNEDGSITVTVDGYEVTVDSNGNVKVEGEGTTPEDPSDTENIVTTPPTTQVGKDTIFKDPNSNDKEAYIPKGFKVSGVADEQKIDTGLVVIAPDGSEFVWVPVNKTTLEVDGIAGKIVAEEVKEGEEVNYRGVLWGNFSTTDTSTKIDYSDNGYREPGVVTDSGSSYDNNSTFLEEMNNILGTKFINSGDFKKYMQDEYNAIIGSIKIKGGFYIGRYESSLSGSTETEVATEGDIQSKRNVMPTSAGNAGTYRWYGLYAKQHEYATVINKNYQTNIKSSMIYGSMYDAVMNWALYGADKTDADEITTNIAKRGPEYTGALPGDKIKNIYDLGNNLGEWTAEACNTSFRVSRGRCLHY